MNITSTGKNLDILLISRNNLSCDWLTFSSFYSIKRNIPDANVSVIALRDFRDGTSSFNWCCRLNVPFFQIKSLDDVKSFHFLNKLNALQVAVNRGFVSKSVLVLDPLHVAVRTLSDKVLGYFSRFMKIQSKGILYFNKSEYESQESILNKVTGNYEKELNSFIQATELCTLCPSNDLATFCRIERCSQLNLTECMNRKMQAPFNLADYMAKNPITLNESKVLQLWSEMKYLYFTVR